MPLFKLSPLKVSLLKTYCLAFALLLSALLWSWSPAFAQHDAAPHAAAHNEAGHGPNTAGSVATEMTETAEKTTGHDVGPHGGGHETSGHGADAHGTEAHGADAHGAGHGDGHGEKHETPGTFDPHGGTWLNPVARLVFGLGPVQATTHGGETHFSNIKYDFLVIALFIMTVIAILGVLAAKKMQVRPAGKPMSLSHVVETAAEGYRNYLIGVMGPALGRRYAPLISSFFFTILFFNWMGLVPGMLAPTANPNIPVALALVAFVCTHFIAIKEAGFKSWIMHFVGDPVWLAPLNFPLHLVGELIKPLSLSIRLLCNVFGEEMVALQLALLAVGAMALLKLPIPFQLPMLLLGTFFGLLQALVFSTLLAIYIAILSTHHDDHDEHNVHGHTEHVRVHGFDEIVAHPSETPVA